MIAREAIATAFIGLIAAAILLARVDWRAARQEFSDLGHAFVTTREPR